MTNNAKKNGEGIKRKAERANKKDGRDHDKLAMRILALSKETIRTRHEEDTGRTNKTVKNDEGKMGNDTGSRDLIDKKEPKVADLAEVSRQWIRQKQLHSAK